MTNIGGESGNGNNSRGTKYRMQYIVGGFNVDSSFHTGELCREKCALLKCTQKNFKYGHKIISCLPACLLWIVLFMLHAVAFVLPFTTQYIIMNSIQFKLN